MTFKTLDVEQKTISILKVLQNLQEPAGARVISKNLKDYGINLSERGVRYHLKIMDERGLTQLVGRIDGRQLTENGISEIKNARAKDKVGFAISRIELLAFRTDFDYQAREGLVPVNVSLFDKVEMGKLLKIMRPAFEKGLCVSNLIVLAKEGEAIGEMIVPHNKIGLATVCSVIINGTLLKAGIPMDSRFGGILQLKDNMPVRFTEIIHYNGSSLDPTEIFIKANMTRVKNAIATGCGEILANFREIPAVCKPTVKRVLDGLKSAGIGGVAVMGNTSESICEIPVDLNRIGLVLLGGLNPIALAQEAGLNVENRSMSTIIDYHDLKDYREVFS